MIPMAYWAGADGLASIANCLYGQPGCGDVASVKAAWTAWPALAKLSYVSRRHEKALARTLPPDVPYYVNDA